MKKHSYLVVYSLIGVTAAYCLLALVLRVLSPLTLLPAWDMPLLLFISLTALCIARMMGANARQPWLMLTLLGGVTLTLLPLCAGLTVAAPLWQVFVVNTLAFGASSFLYLNLDSSAPAPLHRVKPVADALLLFLAGQALQSIFLP